MKCLHPLWIEHPRLKKLKRYGFENTFTEQSPIPIPCGKCHECLKRKASDWKLRLIHEWKYSSKSAWFVTLTIAPEFYKPDLNPSTLMRDFLESIRHATGKSVRHWFVTELGEDHDRLHFHGIVFDCKLTFNEFRSHWKFGFSWLGYCTDRTIFYIVKYILKPQFNHKPRVYCTRGIGKGYITPLTEMLHNRGEKGVFYVVVNGFRYTLPRYYRNKLFPDDWLQSQRELLADTIPKMVVNGVEYKDIKQYTDARYRLYQDTLKRGTSLPSFTDINALIRSSNSAESNFIVPPPKYVVEYYGFTPQIRNTSAEAL